MLNILILNAGSSSLKFQVIATDDEHAEQHEYKQLAKGAVERVGGQASLAFHSSSGAKLEDKQDVADLQKAVSLALDWIVSDDSKIESVRSAKDIHAVGHRVVHGGERFHDSALITPEVIKDIEACSELAPLHNKGNLQGIAATQNALGEKTPQVAVFDTAFHHTLEEHAFLYALPHELYEKYGVRRYGFHGTSHRYVAERFRRAYDRTPEQTSVITLHLGNGCSACAIRNGKSLDTSMGMTPLEGLVMGTRSGDIDPAILEFLAGKEGLNPGQLDDLLNKKSGLLGISGTTNDMRDLQSKQSTDARAKAAIDVFCYRAKKYIGAYLAAMGGAEAIIFTGGIGEHSDPIRARIASGLSWMGLELDAERNAQANGKEAKISKDGCRLDAYVIPTNEELMIAYDTVRCLKQ